MNVDRPVDYKRIGSRSIDVVFIETDQIIPLILISCLSKRKEEPTAVTYTAELSIRTYPLTAGAEVVPVIASSPCKAPVSFGHVVWNERVYHLQRQGGDIHISIQIICFPHFYNRH